MIKTYHELYQKKQEELQPVIALQKVLLQISDESFDDTIQYIKTNFFIDKKSLRQLFININSLMYSRPLLVNLYGRILNHLSKKIKKICAKFDITSSEISSFFTNKVALLTLLENNIITKELIVDKILNKMNQPQSELNFFYPEIENTKKLPNTVKLIDHDNLRVYGQNEDKIAKAIRDDKVDIIYKEISIVSLTVKLNVLVNSQLKNSRYETFNFVESFGKKPSLIEYSAFFGSIQVFKFLLELGAEMSQTLPEFAVAGGSIEIIHLIEENKLMSFGPECIQTAVEFFRFDLVDYFLNVKKVPQTIFNLFASISHYNLDFFTTYFISILYNDNDSVQQDTIDCNNNGHIDDAHYNINKDNKIDNDFGSLNESNVRETGNYNENDNNDNINNNDINIDEDNNKFNDNNSINYNQSTIKENDQINVCIQYATKYQNVEVLKVLLINQEVININYQTNYGESSLFIAASNGYNEILDLLLDCKHIDVNLANFDGVLFSIYI